MLDEGPPLEALLHRLAECPPEFIETCANPRGNVQVVAVIADHYREFGPDNPVRLDDPFFVALKRKPKDQVKATRHWGLLSVAVWLLHDPWLLARQHLAERGWQWLQSDALSLLSQMIRPEHCIADPDRREELARLCLHAHGLRPSDESELQALDRLNTLDSVERQRVLQATAKAERRAREVREAMAQQRALESASRYGE